MVTILSLGAGVQSSTLALMSANGYKVPRLDAAIFADTQAEPERVYRWLDYLEQKILESPRPFPVYRVTEGNLTEESFKERHIQKPGCNFPIGTPYINKLIPIFGIGRDGKRTAAIGRKCTTNFKITPVLREARKIAGVRYGEKKPVVDQWIGISYDEIQRMKESREPWLIHSWPLVSLRMRRSDCLDWMKYHGYEEPPRSACYYCPFHSDDEWIFMKDHDKKEWDKAVAFDRDLRERFKSHDRILRMEVFLHSTCKPLDEVDFKRNKDGEDLFSMKDECEGMCGV